MATDTVQPGIAPANPSRRSMLGILAAGPVATLPALAALQCSTGAEAAPTGSLAEPIRRYRAIVADCDRFDTEVHMPALTACAKAVSEVAHERTRCTFKNINHEHISLSTEDVASVAMARRVLADGWTKNDPDYQSTLTELAKAADHRDAKIASIRKRFDIDRLDKREDELSALLCDAISTVVFTKVRSLDDLADKVAFITETESWTIEDYQERIAADIGDLAGRA